MSVSLPLPRLFGPYVLTRSLSRDLLGETFRAGTAAGRSLRPVMLIRAFDGESVDRGALLPAMETAVGYLDEVKGPAVAKGAVLGSVDEVPFAGIEYIPGRTLDLLFSGGGQEPVALPIEHALLITEKILIALEAWKPIARGTGAPHGFLIPAFITVSNDGDVRVFGAGLGSGLLPCLKAQKAQQRFGPYIAPEVAASGKPSIAGDIYSAAAVLYESLTGKPPAAGSGLDALNGAVLALNGNPIPDDLKRLLAKGLEPQPERREKDVVGYRKELGKLLYGGPYAPSTFNLAFFMHHQFEKAIERERKEMASEELVDAKQLMIAEEEAARAKAEAAAAAARPVARPPVDVTLPKFGLETGVRTLGGTPMPKKGGLGGIPIPAVAAIVTVLVAGGLYITMGRGGKKPAPAAQPTPAAAAAVPTTVPTPLPPPTPKLVGKEDPEFQRLLAQKLAEEEKKLQEQMAKKQEADRKKQADLERTAAEEARKLKEAEDAARGARDRADKEEATRLAREAQEARDRQEAARKAAEAALPKTKEGDLIDPSLLDSQPKAVKVVKPELTMMARQRGISGIVMMRVLVSEGGRAEKVEVIRDTSPKVGLAESCATALRQWEWQPAMKDGKRVKTWIVVPIPFQKG